MNKIILQKFPETRLQNSILLHLIIIPYYSLIRLTQINTIIKNSDSLPILRETLSFLLPKKQEEEEEEKS